MLDRYDRQARDWAGRHHGSVVELHAYAAPSDPGAPADPALGQRAIERLHGLYPETGTARIVAESQQWRADCPLFGIGGFAGRPRVLTPYAGLVLAGDGIRIDLPVALMERAASTGWHAANCLLARWNLAGHTLYTVPTRGAAGPVALAGGTRSHHSAGSHRGVGIRCIAGARSDYEGARGRIARMNTPEARGRIVRRRPQNWPLRPAPAAEWVRQQPTHADARPALIDAAVKRAQARPSGNWFVLAASREIRGDRPYAVKVAGAEVVAWRDTGGRLLAGPGACPHLGAPMALAAVDCGALVCRWHGLRVGPGAGAGWRPLPAHDDGVLAWVRLDTVGGEEPLDAPVVPARPAAATSIDSVATLTGVCEPADIVANRLDPWHGSWFHPYWFGQALRAGRPR